MQLDVRELRAFYLSPLGRMVRQLVSARIREIWPDVKAQRLAGIGHPTPYFRPYLGEAERLIAIMPAAQGVLAWPSEGPNRTLLAYEHSLPLDDASIDRILVVHALEATDNPNAMLREIWRVLVPGGRLLVIVPHRSGLWAQTDRTPFGIGRPFSRSQIARLAEESLFAPQRVEPFLFVPPSTRRFLLGSARSWERAGRLWPRFAGAIALEAEKQMFQGVPLAKKARGVSVLVPALAPARPGAACAAPRLSGAAGTPPARRTGSRTTTAR